MRNQMWQELTNNRLLTIRPRDAQNAYYDSNDNGNNPYLKSKIGFFMCKKLYITVSSLEKSDNFLSLA